MMKLIGKNVTRDVVERFLDWLYWEHAYFTGDTRTTTYHYLVGPNCEEVARITHNNTTNLYNIRMLDA